MGQEEGMDGVEATESNPGYVGLGREPEVAVSASIEELNKPVELAHEVPGVLDEIEQYVHALPGRLHEAFRSLIESARK